MSKQMMPTNMMNLYGQRFQGDGVTALADALGGGGSGGGGSDTVFGSVFGPGGNDTSMMQMALMGGNDYASGGAVDAANRIAKGGGGPFDYSNSMRLYYDLINSGQMTPQVAQGFAANFSHESNKHGMIDPGAHEIGQKAGHGGYGEGQWTGDRRKDFLNYANKTGQDWRQHDTNTNYLLQDINKGYEKQMFDRHIAHSPTGDAATRNVEQFYERAGKPMMGARLEHSHNIGNIAQAGNPFANKDLAAFSGSHQPMTQTARAANEQATMLANNISNQPRLPIAQASFHQGENGGIGGNSLPTPSNSPVGGNAPMPPSRPPEFGPSSIEWKPPLEIQNMQPPDVSPAGGVAPSVPDVAPMADPIPSAIPDELPLIFSRGGTVHDAVQRLARGGAARSPFGEGGSAEPGDDAHRFVQDQLHGDRIREIYRESPMLQQYADRTANQAIENNTIRPSATASEFVQQALNKQEPQLPQYDRQMHEALKEGSKEALMTGAHIAAYGVPYVGEAMMANDAMNAARYFAGSGEKTAGDTVGHAMDAAGALMGGRGKALERGLALGAGAAANVMQPESAEAKYSFYNNPAVLEAVERLASLGRGVSKDRQLGIFHNMNPAMLPQTLERFGGTIPIPSMAISQPRNNPGEAFGGLTLVGRPHLAHPTEDIRVFRSDAYTPRVPTIRSSQDGSGGFYDWIPAFHGADVSSVENRVAPTPENISAYAKTRPLAGGEGDDGFSGGIGLMKALAHPEVKSFEDVQRFGRQLQSEYAGQREWGNAYDNFLQNGMFLRDYQKDPENLDSTTNYFKAVLDYMRSGDDWSKFREHYPTIGDSERDLVLGHVDRIRELKPSYMEAKAMRPVGLDEFAGAVVPTGAYADDAMKSLRDWGMDPSNIHIYQRGVEDMRLKRIEDNFADNFFNEGGAVEKGKGGSLGSALEVIAKLGKLKPEGSGYVPKPGMPETVNIPGIGRVEARPIEGLEAAKNKLMEAQGKSTEPPILHPVNPLFAAKVAGAFERMKHDPSDPLIKRSYDAMISNVMDQYRAAKEAGYEFHFLRNGERDPYHLSPSQGYADLVNNGRLSVFPTDQGFGTLNKSAEDNPLLRRVGRVGDKDDAVANDAFRLVHDVNGHFGPGNPFFRAAGEERAYQLHAPTFDEAAIPALTAETRGQNSWVNFGPHAAHNANADAATTTYADQKIGRLPDWASAPPPAEDRDVDDYIRSIIRRHTGGRAGFDMGGVPGEREHEFVRHQLDTGEKQMPQYDGRFDRAFDEFVGVPQAEAGEGSALAKAVSAARRYGKQTVDEPQRNMFPGIYANPRDIAEEAETRVAPESMALKRLFGVSRQDLYDIGKDRVGNAEPDLAFKAGARGSDAASNVMTRRNANRLQDVLVEAGEQPGLRTGMDAWYVMDPLYQRMEQLMGPEEAKRMFNNLNHATGTMSPGSPVTTEVNRGLAAYHLHNVGRYGEFVEHGGNPASATAIPEGRNRSFAEEFPDLLGHPYHSTSQAPILQKYFDTGSHGMQSPKVPLYIQSSGVPETGHQTALPVPDAHFTRAVGLSDTRKADKGAGDSMKMSEYQQVGPWFASKVANKIGLEAVPAQARLWGAMSKHTGVDTAIGAPKLEMIANEIMRISQKYGITPERARDMVLQGELFNQGGAVNDNNVSAVERARSLAATT